MTIPIRFVTVITTTNAADLLVTGGSIALGRSFRAARSQGLLYWVKMSAGDGREIVRLLQCAGLQFLEAGQAKHIAVVDMFTGPLVPCPWLRVTGTSGSYRAELHE